MTEHNVAPGNAENVRLEAAEAAAWKLFRALLDSTSLNRQARTEALHAWIAYDQDYDRYDSTHLDGLEEGH